MRRKKKLSIRRRRGVRCAAAALALLILAQNFLHTALLLPIQAVRLAEAMVRQYSQSMYVEAAARNEAAIRLYRRLGYDCLNSVTLRKDFPGYDYDVVRTEQVYGERFEIRKDKE